MLIYLVLYNLGVDAEIALSFHKMREANTNLFQSQLVNKGNLFEIRIYVRLASQLQAGTAHWALRQCLSLIVPYAAPFWYAYMF